MGDVVSLVEKVQEHVDEERAKELAKIPPSQPVSLVYLPPPKSLFETILELASGATILESVPSPRKWLSAIESLARQPVWAVLPGVPEVQ